MNLPNDPQPYDSNGAVSPPEENAPPKPPEQTESIEPAAAEEPTSHRDNWIWGLALILMGGLFLLQNFSAFHLNNWWAVFILIPAVGSFSTAWRHYRDSGRFNARARNSLFGGMILGLVALLFLLNLDIGHWWPIFLVLAGLGMILNAIFPD